MAIASELVAALTVAGQTVATAESLTGGLLGGAVTSVCGSSAVYAGGVVSYATSAKEVLLGIPADVLATEGAVSAKTAEAMALGVRRLLGTTYGLATTGVAGPDLQEGKPVGTVYVGVATPVGVASAALLLPGDREAIRTATVDAALRLLLDQVPREEPRLG